jgi:hypothetical protein
MDTIDEHPDECCYRATLIARTAGYLRTPMGVVRPPQFGTCFYDYLPRNMEAQKRCAEPECLHLTDKLYCRDCWGFVVCERNVEDFIHYTSMLLRFVAFIRGKWNKCKAAIALFDYVLLNFDVWSRANSFTIKPRWRHVLRNKIEELSHPQEIGEDFMARYLLVYEHCLQ